MTSKLKEKINELNQNLAAKYEIGLSATHLNDLLLQKWTMGATGEEKLHNKFIYIKVSYEEWFVYKEEFKNKFQTTFSKHCHIVKDNQIQMEENVWLIYMKDFKRLLDFLNKTVTLSLFRITNDLVRFLDLQEERQQAIEEYLNRLDFDFPDCSIRLRPYQQDGVRFLLHNIFIGDGCILAYDMGLGKTLTSLAAAKILGKKTMVIAPANLCFNWQLESQKIQYPVEVFSYEKIPKSNPDELFLLVIDEAHYIKNRTAQRTKKVLALSRLPNCYGVILLSGTPIKNGQYRNLLPLLQAIKHPLAENHYQYLETFCFKEQNKFGRDYSASKNGGILYENIKDQVLYLHRTEVLTELPPQQIQYLNVKPSPTQLKEYHTKINEAIADYQNAVEKGEKQDALALVTLTILRKLSSEIKLNTSLGLLEELLESKQKVVFFTGFKHTNDLVQEYLEKNNISYVMLNDNINDTKKAVTKFQSGKVDVFLSTVYKGGVGLTLTAATTIILHDRPFDPGDVAQALARIHRMGQAKHTYALLPQFGIDYTIDESHDAKIDNIQKVIISEIKKNPDYVKLLARG
jgi:SNF2 family DNA or RNA helicase